MVECFCWETYEKILLQTLPKICVYITCSTILHYNVYSLFPWSRKGAENLHIALSSDLLFILCTIASIFCIDAATISFISKISLWFPIKYVWRYVLTYQKLFSLMCLNVLPIKIYLEVYIFPIKILHQYVYICFPIKNTLSKYICINI